MLVKDPKKILVQKIRALLLTEADSNTLHKINVNVRLIPFFETSSSMPQEIIGSRRIQATTHLALSKKLIADISNTKKISTATTCTDTTNCYDRVARPYDSLCDPCFGMDLIYLVVLF